MVRSCLVCCRLKIKENHGLLLDTTTLINSTHDEQSSGCLVRLRKRTEAFLERVFFR